MLRRWSRRHTLVCLALPLASVGWLSCSSAKNEGFETRPEPDRATPEAGAPVDLPDVSLTLPDIPNTEPLGCQYRDDMDHDGDGYSYAEGDCNDCDPNVNPGAYDVPGNQKDEDCSGTPDDEPSDCDTGLALSDSDPFSAARAIGLCRTNVSKSARGKSKTWGVLSAKYVKADGNTGMNPLSHGLVPKFGAANVQQGKSMLVLSSGTARAPGQSGFKSPQGENMQNTCDAPISGLDTPACYGTFSGDPWDSAALEVEIRVPTNAKSFGFNLNFFTYEFPRFICSKYNDFYVTWMSPSPPGSGNENISFDQDKNPISVNNSLLQVCTKQTAGGKYFACPLGNSMLKGTGFDETERDGPHAATGWLRTTAPAKPGSTITLRFAIWDAGDAKLDSTVLIDKFEWAAEEATGATTAPVRDPK